MADNELNIKIKASDDGVQPTLEDIVASFKSIYGAVAKAVEIVVTVMEKIKKAQEAVEKMRLEFDAAAFSASHLASAIALDNLRIEDQIAKLEGRPTKNRLAIALTEAANRAIDLTNAMEEAIRKEEKLLKEEAIGIWKSFASGQVRTDDLYNKLAPSFNKIIELQRQGAIEEATFVATHNSLLQKRTTAQVVADGKELASIKAKYAGQITATSQGVLGLLDVEQRGLDASKAAAIKSAQDEIPRVLQRWATEQAAAGRTHAEIAHFADQQRPKLQKLVDAIGDTYKARQETLDRLRLTVLNLSNAEIGAQVNLREHLRYAQDQDNQETQDRTANIRKRLQGLDAEAKAVADQAGTFRASTASVIEETAAVEANKLITEINAESREKHVPVLKKEQEAYIRAAEAQKTFAGAAIEVDKVLGSDIVKTQEQTDKVRAMSAAYGEGGVALQKAQQDSQLAPYRQKVNELQKAFDDLSRQFPEDKDRIEAMARALRETKAELAAMTAAVKAENEAQQAANTNKQATDLNREAAAVRGYAQAALGGADAVRKFNIEQKVLEYTRNAGLLQSTEAIEAYRKTLKELDDAEQLKAAADKVRSLDRIQELQNEIQQLNKLRSAAVQNGQSTLAIDALVHQDRLQQQRDLSNMLLQTGKIKDGIHAFFLDYREQAQITGQKIHDAFMQTMNGLTQNMSKFIVEGKADWKSFATSAIEQFVEMGLQWAIQQTLMTAIHKLMNKNKESDDDEAMANKSATNVAEVISDAAVAAAGAFAYYSAFVPELAEGLAAAQFAEGISWAGVAAFERGGIVPQTGLILAHQGETVLPASMSGDGSGLSSVGRTVHVHMNVNAIDSASFKDTVGKHGHMIGELVNKALKKKGIK